MKKSLFVLMLFSALLSVFACSRNNTASAKDKDLRIFVDDTKREIPLAKNIERIAVSGRIAQAIVFPLAKDKLVGVAEPWLESEKPFIDPEYLELPVIGRIYGSSGNLNKETLMRLEVDVVIDLGQYQDGIREEMQDFTDKTGVPFVHLTLDSENLRDVYKRLGELLGKEDIASSIIAYIDEAETLTNKVLETEPKKDLIFLMGNNARRILAKGSYFASVPDRVANNLAVFDKIDSNLYAPYINSEHLLNYKSDDIIFAAHVDRALLEKDDTIKSLSAYKNKNYHFFPARPYDNMGFPPGPLQVYGTLWCINALYETEYSKDIERLLEEFDSLFF